MSEIIIGLTGMVLIVIASVCCLIGAPLAIYYTLRMGRCKKTTPRSWHDLWGLNRNNLIFFPDLLSERGQDFRRRAIKGWIIGLIGAACAAAAAFLGAFGSMAAP